MLNETFHVSGTHHLYSLGATAAASILPPVLLCLLVFLFVHQLRSHLTTLSGRLSHFLSAIPPPAHLSFFHIPAGRSCSFISVFLSLLCMCVGVCTHRHHWWVNISENSGIKPLKYNPPSPSFNVFGRSISHLFCINHFFPSHVGFSFG